MSASNSANGHKILASSYQTEIILGDCLEVLRTLKDNSIDLIITSPPYADQRKGTYGGIHPDKYVEWFLPISKELLRVLQPTGTFILNIKEKVSISHLAWVTKLQGASTGAIAVI